jgi:hypothetical protein
MGTGISRAGLGLAALALGLAGCGSSAGGAGAGAGTGSTAAGGAGGVFAWLHPQSPPAAWRLVAIPSGATMAYPPGWKRQRSDAGTASAVRLGAGGRFLGYLDLTPRQGAETLSNWATFRIEHNSEEGQRDVRRLAAAGGLRFLDGRGTCVKDTYTTKTAARYVEIACLVAGRRDETVIVAAAPPQVWGSESRTLERAIEGVKG